MYRIDTSAPISSGCRPSLGWGSVALLATCLLGAGCASAPRPSPSEEATAEASPDERKAKEGAEDEKAGDTEKTDADDASEQTAEETTTQPDVSAQKQLERAVERARKDDTTDISDTLEQLVDHPEQGHLAAYNLGVLAEKNGDLRAAARWYNRALEKRAGFSSALFNLVRLYLREGRLGDADRVAQKYIDKKPNNLDHKAARLEVLLARERYSDVIRRAKSILQRDQKNVEAMLAMSMANYRLERFELARAILERASDLAPERADIFFQFGLIAMDGEERGKAIANFKKAIEYRPRFAEARNNLGLLYHEAGDYESAADQFEAALEAYPRFKEARLNLGNAYKRLGKPKKAEEQFKKVLDLDASYADAYFNLGLLYMDAEVPGFDKVPRFKKAIEMLNEYKRVSRGQLPNDDPANKYITSAREKIKTIKQRRKMMRQAQKGGGGSTGSSNSSSSSKNGSEGSGSSNQDASTEKTSGGSKETSSDSSSSTPTSNGGGNQTSSGGGSDASGSGNR